MPRPPAPPDDDGARGGPGLLAAPRGPAPQACLTFPARAPLADAFNNGCPTVYTKRPTCLPQGANGRQAWILAHLPCRFSPLWPLLVSSPLAPFVRRPPLPIVSNQRPNGCPSRRTLQDLENLSLGAAFAWPACRTACSPAAVPNPGLASPLCGIMCLCPAQHGTVPLKPMSTCKRWQDLQPSPTRCALTCLGLTGPVMRQHNQWSDCRAHCATQPGRDVPARVHWNSRFQSVGLAQASLACKCCHGARHVARHAVSLGPSHIIASALLAREAPLCIPGTQLG